MLSTEDKILAIASWTEEEVFDFIGDHFSEEIATKFKGKLTAGFEVVVQIMRVQIVTSTRFNLTLFRTSLKKYTAYLLKSFVILFFTMKVATVKALFNPKMIKLLTFDNFFPPL